MAYRARFLQVWNGVALAALTLLARARMIGSALIIVAAALAALPTAVAAQGAATLMADQVFVDRAGRLVAEGSVEVWHGSVRLTADRVVFDQQQDQLIVEGSISISDGPDTVFLADSAAISPNLRAGIIRGARVMLDQQLQIAAARVVRNPNGINQMESVVASTCPVCAADPTPLWEIRADRVTHDENTDQLTFERAQFRFAGVPIFYVPRMRLPGPGLDRSRGVLRPEVRMGSALGLSVGIPYFIPFGEAHDLTLTPILSTEGMATLGFRWRSARDNGGLEIGGQISRDNLRPGETRGYGYVRALYALPHDFRLSANLLAASDRTYLETYDITSDAQLNADITLERVRRDQMIRVQALEFYSLRATDNNDELPNRVAQAEMDQRISLTNTPVGGELRFQLGARTFRRASMLDGVRGRDVSRAYVKLSWRRSEVLIGGIVATGVIDGRIDHVRVGDDSAYLVPVTRRVAQGMIEFRWPWAQTSQRGVRQVIEPVVQIIGSRRSGGALPNDDHTMPELDEGNLFALTRYSGEDARDDGARVNAGLRWSRYDPSGWSTDALVGRIWRRDVFTGFDATHVQPLGRGASDWLLAGRVRNQDGLSMSVRVLISPDSVVSRAETNLAWSGQATTVSTRYLYSPASTFEMRATPLSEWSVDLGRNFTSGWTSTVGWDYDMSLRQVATARAGLEFRNECLAFDMTFARHFVTATNPMASTRINMQIDLLGIGGRAPNTTGRTCRT